MEVISERFSKEEALLDCKDGSCILGFGNVYNVKVMAKLDGMTHQAQLPKRPGSMRKNKIPLERLGLMVRPDGIRLDSLT